MLSRLFGIAFCGECQASLFVLGGLGPGLLLAADIGSRRVDLVVALRLKKIQGFVVLVQAGHSGSVLWVGPEGHGAQDDSGLAGCGCYEHFELRC